MKTIKSNNYIEKIALILFECERCGKNIDSPGICEDCAKKQPPDSPSSPPDKKGRPIEYDKLY